MMDFECLKNMLANPDDNLRVLPFEEDGFYRLMWDRRVGANVIKAKVFKFNTKLNRDEIKQSFITQCKDVKDVNIQLNEEM